MVNRPRYKLNWRTAPSKLTTEDLQDGCCGGHHGYRNNKVLGIRNLHVAPMPPIKFWLNLTYHSGADEVEDFPDGHLGGHLRYRNRTILTILNLSVTPLPSIKIGFNSHYRLGDVV